MYRPCLFLINASCSVESADNSHNSFCSEQMILSRNQYLVWNGATVDTAAPSCGDLDDLPPGHALVIGEQTKLQRRLFHHFCPLPHETPTPNSLKGFRPFRRLHSFCRHVQHARRTLRSYLSL